MGRVEDSFDQFRGGGFAVGAGNGNVQAEGLLVAQLQFADDRKVAADQSLNQFRLRGDAGTDDRQVQCVAR